MIIARPWLLDALRPDAADYGYEDMRAVMREPGAAQFYRQVDIVNMPAG